MLEPLSQAREESQLVSAPQKQREAMDDSHCSLSHILPPHKVVHKTLFSLSQHFWIGDSASPSSVSILRILFPPSLCPGLQRPLILCDNLNKHTGH